MTLAANARMPRLPRVDNVLFFLVIALVVIGLIMIFSVTFMPGISQVSENPLLDFAKQLVFALLGILLMIALMYSDYHIWDRLALPLMGITIAGLVLLLFMPEVNGSRRWLLGGSFQPSEIAKFTVIVYMAKWLSAKSDKLRELTYGLLPFAVFVGFVTGLIILQPNLSTAIIIALCAMAMFFIAGADVIQYLLLLLAGGTTIAVVIARNPYQLARWLTFIGDPLDRSSRESYQIAEVLIALGSGGLTGRGLGTGYSKFGYVPAPHTDSIFALLGEEAGLLGTWLVLALFLLLAYRGFRIASQAADPFGQVLGAGMTFWLVFQAFTNIAVITATIPFTGIPLPFISFGGSALVSSLAAVGVLLSISRERVTSKEADASIGVGRRDGGARVSRASRRLRPLEERRTR